jgi:hypothetical protein
MENMEKHSQKIAEKIEIVKLRNKEKNSYTEFQK